MSFIDHNLFKHWQIMYNIHIQRSRKEEHRIVTARHARIYDALALLVVILVIALDQWTKALVVENLGPPEIGQVRSRE